MSPKMPSAILMDKFPKFINAHRGFADGNFLLSKTSKARRKTFSRKVFVTSPRTRKNNTKTVQGGWGRDINWLIDVVDVFIKALTFTTNEVFFLAISKLFSAAQHCNCHSGRLTGQQLDTKIEIFSENCSPGGVDIILFRWCAVWCKQN